MNSSIYREIQSLWKEVKWMRARLMRLPSRVSGGGGGGGNAIADTIWVEAASFDTLPDASIGDATLMARITAGPQIGQIYKVDSAGTGWLSVFELYKATTVAGLANNEYVQSHAIGRVTSGTEIGGLYIRNSANDDWVRIGPVRTVLTLPAIPSEGMDEVLWTSVGGGTGDGQIWRAYAGQTKWTPTQKFSTKSGTPV